MDMKLCVLFVRCYDINELPIDQFEKRVLRYMNNVYLFFPFHFGMFSQFPVALSRSV